MNPTGYIRPRGDALQAVIEIGEKKIRKTTPFKVGEEGEAQKFLERALLELGATTTVTAPVQASEELTLWATARGAEGRGHPVCRR